MDRGESQAVATVPVVLGERSYAVIVGPGLIADAGQRIAALVPGAACGIVCDESVARLHLPSLEAPDRFDSALKAFLREAGLG